MNFYERILIFLSFFVLFFSQVKRKRRRMTGLYISKIVAQVIYANTRKWLIDVLIGLEKIHDIHEKKYACTVPINYMQIFKEEKKKEKIFFVLLC